jgi:hypothetical protein
MKHRTVVRQKKDIKTQLSASTSYLADFVQAGVFGPHLASSWQVPEPIPSLFFVVLLVQDLDKLWSYAGADSGQ